MADDAAVSLDVEAGAELAAATKGRRWVECLLCTIGLATACMSVASAIYKAPPGIFVGHGRAYYVSVVSAGIVGLVEAYTAVIWLSGTDGTPRQAEQQQQQQQEPQQRGIRQYVLCASFLPLVFMAGLGGVRILVK